MLIAVPVKMKRIFFFLPALAVSLLFISKLGLWNVDKSQHEQLLVASRKAVEHITTPRVWKGRNELFPDLALPYYMGCHQHTAVLHVEHSQKDVHGMTVDVCVRICQDENTLFAMLLDGSRCLCTYLGGAGIILKEDKCQSPCTGSPLEMCGGKNTVHVYRINVHTGDSNWSLWTPLSLAVQQSPFEARFKGCHRLIYSPTNCFAQIEYKSVSPKENLGDSELVKHFIGCFTQQSFLGEISSMLDVQAQNHSEPSESLERIGIRCIDFCKKLTYRYALVNDSACMCSQSLGWSQPIDTCKLLIGVLAFSTDITEDKVYLKFEPRQTKRRIVVIAYYRGGSSFTSSILSNYPGALYFFEPGKTLGTEWPDSAYTFALEDERANIISENLLQPLFDCNFQVLPGRVFTHFPTRSDPADGLHALQNCKQDTYQGQTRCWPLLLEQCLMAPFVIAKTTRWLHPASIRAFVEENDEESVHLIHALRDPRSVLASRGKLSKYYKARIPFHIETTCKEMIDINDLFIDLSRHHSNVHTVHYEELVMNPRETANQLYKSLDVELPQQVRIHINNSQSVDGSKDPYSVHRADSKTHVDSWNKLLSSRDVEQADKTTACKKLYKIFPGYYQPAK